jgi:uncharacterized membrane protein YesL
MIGIFRILREAWEDFRSEMLLWGGLNGVTVLLMIPLVTLPPALVALWHVASLRVRGERVSWSAYWRGFRRYFWKAWGLALFNGAVLFVLLTNLRFYRPEVVPFEIHPLVSLWIRSFFVALAFLWFVFQAYPAAMLVQREGHRMWVAVRDAMAVMFHDLTFSFLLIFVLFLATGLSVLLPPVGLLGGIAYVALVSNRSVYYLWEAYQEERRAGR